MQKIGVPKIGDIREDGRVYNGKNSCFKNGECWATMEAFLKIRGDSWYEKRAVMDANVETRLLEKEASAKRAQEARNIREERERLKLLIPKKKVLTTEEKFQRSRDNKRRHYLKKNEAKTKARKEAKAIKVEAERVEKIKRLAEKAKKKEEAALAKSLRPKRVLLTAEQRKENERQGKRNYKHVRRARINNCEVKATPKIVEEARKNAGDRCYYCGKKCKLTLDHFDSLSKGGAHCVSNFVFACFSCNSRKRDLDPFEFMESNLAISF
jgi:5-methylcytosine-specific restriction endonuclease McrA